MLTLIQQEKTAPTSATVQTPDSANLKVNQVFEINALFSLTFFFQMLENLLVNVAFYHIQILIYINASFIVLVLT